MMPTVARARLLTLYDDVERRARATTDERTWWPCRRGCDTCCHRLADIPQLVRAEWELLQEGLDALAPEVRAEVDARIADLAAAEREARLPRHIVCPMLDVGEGACLVYAHRPAACRTYGFYVERGIGLHCDMITEAVAARSPEEEPLVWGNQDGVAAALAQLPHGGDEEPDEAYALARRAAAPLPLTRWALSSSSSSSCPSPAPPSLEPEPSSPSSEM